MIGFRLDIGESDTNSIALAPINENLRKNSQSTNDSCQFPSFTTASENSMKLGCSLLDLKVLSEDLTPKKETQ